MIDYILSIIKIFYLETENRQVRVFMDRHNTDQRKNAIPPKSKAIGIAGIDSMTEKKKSGRFTNADEKSEKISETNEKNPERESSVTASINAKPVSAMEAAAHIPKQALFMETNRCSYRSIRTITVFASPADGSKARSGIEIFF